MRLFIILCALIHLAVSNSVDQKSPWEVCYEGYGCYSSLPPFWDLIVRPLVFLPESPSKVGTKFILYTRENLLNGVKINSTDASEFFGASRGTKFIVHGFLHHGYKDWIIQMKNAILQAEDVNVISVDWSKGNGFPYTQATANTRIVGSDIAILVNSYISKGLMANAENVHIIGHSLGSHIAGYAGERIKGLGRITGLDPAGPEFENADPKVRLDPSDAKFVDVIHTDGAATLQLGLGLMQASGHVDFYPNGGKDQPNCPATSGKLLGAIFGALQVSIEAIEDSVSCSHLAAIHFYTASILQSDCSFSAFKCSSLNDFNNGKCISCSAKGCNRMGYWASPNNDLGSVYFTTQDATRSPYCQHHFVATLNSNNLFGQTQVIGKFVVTLSGDRATSSSFVIEDDNKPFRQGSTENRLISSTRYIGEDINQITVSFTKTSNILFILFSQDKWSFKSIEIAYGDNQKRFKFCPSTTYIQSGKSAVFNRC